MNDQRIRNVLKAIRCCRDDMCTCCPMQREICDELIIERESLPSELIDIIEDELEGMLVKKRQ